MGNATEGFKIKLNQNLWGLIAGFVALGTAEYFRLCVLFWFAFVVSIFMSVSVFFTTIAYTKTYWKDK